MTPTEAVRQTTDGRKLLSQLVVEPPPPPTSTSTLTESFMQLPNYGKNILLFVPTANEFKNRVLNERIISELKEQQNLLVAYSKDLDSGVGEQPYDEKGFEGALNRIHNSLVWLHENENILEEQEVGTILVGAIENYIRKGVPAVDYGIVMVYNATIDKVAITISNGVTVPAEFLEEAEAYGFDDDAEKCGKKTVGKVLASLFGVDHRDWHKVVCGTSRYQLLEDAVTKLNVPLDKEA